MIFDRLLKHITLLTLFIGSLLAMAGEPLDGIVAIVNDDVVMASELSRHMERVKLELRERKMELPPPEILQKQVLERVILLKIQMQLAQQTGIQVDDDTLNRAISNIAAQNKVSLEQFRAVLEQEGYDFDRFREDIRNEIIVARLRQKQVDNLIHVTDREVDSYLATQNKQGGLDTEYNLAHILIATPEGASSEDIAETREQAEEVLNKLRAGADFKQMAASISGDPRAFEGGELGWRKAGELPPPFAEAAAALKEGGISNLIRSPSGFHIIKVLGVRSNDSIVVRQTHARHILIKPDELTTPEQAQERLLKLKTRIEGGENFAELARSHSVDKSSAAKGGDLGWVNPGDTVPKFEEVMNGLKPGEISQPFESDFGWHIVQVLERRDHDSTEEALRSKAREAIRQRKLEEERQAWLRRLRDEAYVEYRMDG